MLGLMLKTIGGIMIVLGAYLVSREKVQKLKARVRTIDGIISGFVSLEEYICGMLIPVSDAVLLSAEDAGDAKKIFISASKGNGGIRERFSTATKELVDEDSEAVLRYVSQICSSDEAERRTAFSLIRARLSDQRNAALDDLARLEKLYNAAGFSFGILVVILLF